jgi:catechol 2,3-dioxygenase-like lactoylglutathione lyase family enzyme
MLKKYFTPLLVCVALTAVVSVVRAAPPVSNAAAQARINFTIMPVADLARAEAFYTRALGMKVLLRPHDEIALNMSGDVNAAETMLFLKQTANAKTQSHDGVGVGLLVSDVAAVAAQVRASGYAIEKEVEPRVVSAPNVQPAITMTKIIVRDPDGNIIELVQLR